MGIKSEKTDFGVKIVYQGYINNMDVIYEVPICNCPLYLFEVNPNIKYEIINEIATMQKMTKEQIVQDRYDKFRNISYFKEI